MKCSIFPKSLSMPTQFLFALALLYALAYPWSCSWAMQGKDGYFTDELPYDPPAIYLTWQRNPSKTMTVQWIVHQNEIQDFIEFRASKDKNLWRGMHAEGIALPGLKRYQLYRAELVNLLPNTEYVFRIGSNGKKYKFLTAPLDLTSPLTFAVGGDIYHDYISSVMETNMHVAKTSPLFVLAGGDLAYTGGKLAQITDGLFLWMSDLFFGSTKMRNNDRWIEFFTTYKKTMITPKGHLIPIIPAIGNHEVHGAYERSSKDAALFYTFFPFPGEKGRNVLDFGDYLSIFVMDSGHTHPIAGEQTEWLATTLLSRKKVPHKFALYHVPAYPCVRNMNNKRSNLVREYWVPLFEAHGIVAAFEHHDHAYKRTHKIRNDKIDPSGVLYLGDGAWGVAQPRYPDTSANRWYLAKTAARRHFIKMTLHGSHRKAEAIDSNGQIFDEVEF